MCQNCGHGNGHGYGHGGCGCGGPGGREGGCCGQGHAQGRELQRPSLGRMERSDLQEYVADLEEELNRARNRLGASPASTSA